MRFRYGKSQLGLLTLALLLAASCAQADVSELEEDNKELRAEIRELREDLRALRKDTRELRERVALAPSKVELPPLPADQPLTDASVAPLPNPGPPPKQSNVKIQIESNPRGATVFLGEKILGKTPLLYQHPPGTEQLLLRIDKPGYRPRLMSIRPDEDAKISVQLARQ